MSSKNKSPKQFDNFSLDLIIKKRLAIIFICLVFCFIILVIRLVNLQITDFNTYYQRALNNSLSVTEIEHARGNILDKDLNILVTNRQITNLVYQKNEKETKASREEKTKLLISLFNPDISKMSFRQKQDALLYYYPDVVDDQFKVSNKLSLDELYNLKLKYIDLKLIESKLTFEQLQFYSIYSKMLYYNNLVVIEDLSPQQVALFLEHKDQLSGIKIDFSWQRFNNYNVGLSSVFGAITNEVSGIPRENALYLLASGYRLNSRLGRSGLESFYEYYLKGNNSIALLNQKNNHQGAKNIIYNGRLGDDLVVSLDNTLQQISYSAAQKFLLEKAYQPTNKYFNQIYIVATNPNNGDVLANVGLMIDKDKNIISVSDRTYTTQYSVGSSIKGAVVYMALDRGLFKAGETIVDEPIKIKGTELKKSYVNLGIIDEQRALANSSNVYMFYTAIRLGEGKYEYNKPLNLKPEAFNYMRANFARFGLGVSTGLDVDYEATGYKSNKKDPGFLLDFAIGQFESYTPMQLAQYVSTVANGKYRYQLRFGLATYGINNNYTSQNPVKILNSIDNPKAIERVQSGFRLCVTDGYCKRLNNLDYEVAAKTGSAEDFYYDEELKERIDVVTNTLVAYAPYKTPQVAFSCVVPYYANGENTQSNGCELVIYQIMKEYTPFINKQ